MLLLAGVLAILAGLAVFLGHTPPEPEYAGIKLSDWAKNYPRNRDVADAAIRHFGTNALPWLIEWLAAEPPPRWKQKILIKMAKLPARFGGAYARNSLDPCGWNSMNRHSFAWH